VPTAARRAAATRTGRARESPAGSRRGRRYQARSGAALEAISLALGIPVAIIVAVSAAEYTAQTGNLSDRQLLIRAANIGGPYVPELAELPSCRASKPASIGSPPPSTIPR
jgi:putative ABC transport system permease protein